MNSEELALALDPERRRAGWWCAFRACPTCSKDVFRCSCVVDVRPASLPMGWDYTGPALAEDDIAAFTFVRPVLLAVGLCIYDEKHAGVIIEFPHTSDPHFAGKYAPACAAAVAWLVANEPQRWDAAVGEVGHG